MAKYILDYSCGHSKEVQLYGSERSRQYRIEAASRRLCPDCWRRDEEAQGPLVHLFFRTAFPPDQPGAFVIALEHAFPVREQLKAAGYAWDPDAMDVTGWVGAVTSGRGKQVWRRDYPLTPAGRDAWLAEADRLRAEGIAKPGRVERQPPVAAEIELALHEAMMAAATAQAAREAAAEEARRKAEQDRAEAVQKLRDLAASAAPEPLLIDIAPCDDGATVRFPRDVNRNDRFRRCFPAARWDGEAGAWHLPGKLAQRRAQVWADEEMEVEATARKAAELIRSDAAYEGRALAPEGAAYMASLKAEGRKMSTLHVSVRTAGEELLLRFAYNAAAIALAKAANGKWDPDRRCWVYPISAARSLHPVVDKIETTLATTQARP